MWKKLKNFLWQWRGVWITTPSVAGLVIILRFFGLFQPWEWAVFDQYMRLRPDQAVDDRIVIVGIDELDIQKWGTDSFSDHVYANLLIKLKARQPRAIGLDIYRNLPVEPGHQELVDVFKSTPYIVGIQKVIGNKSWDIIPPPPALKVKQQVGANDLLEDADQKVRRGFLYLSDGEGKIIWSFGLHLSLHYLEKEGISLKRIEGTQYQLGKTLLTPLEANDGGYVRADADGYQILLNYRGGSKHFSIVSMSDVILDRLPANWGKDKVILIGKIGESSKDLFTTPYSSGLLDLPEPMAGVEIHANLVSQLISAALDSRPLIKSWPEYWENIWIFLWAGVGATLTWGLRYVGGVSRFSWRRVLAPLLAGGTLIGSTYAAFLNGWWIPIVPPLLSLTGAAIIIIVYIAQTAAEIRKTFGRYLTDEIVANLLESPEGLKLGGERRKITILTSDLRGFTALSEQLQPEEVVKILNIYLRYMTDVITSHQGTIDKFMGDGMLILFGAPITRENDTSRAVACAVGMQLAMQPVNEQLALLGYPQLEMGIGIHTGEAVVGNIGSEKRTEYSVIGNHVNLAFRIETYTIGGQILISESTLAEVGSIVKTDLQKQIKPKGVKQALTVYEVIGIGGEYNLFLTKQEEIFLPINQPISIQYVLLDGKHIEDTLFKAKIVKLSAKCAEVVAESQEDNAIPLKLSNIKLNFYCEKDQETSEDIYAKVLENPGEANSFYIRFTAKPIKIAAKLDAIYKSLKPG